jgi:hypothetical protein
MGCLAWKNRVFCRIVDFVRGATRFDGVAVELMVGQCRRPKTQSLKWMAAVCQMKVKACPLFLLVVIFRMEITYMWPDAWSAGQPIGNKKVAMGDSVRIVVGAVVENFKNTFDLLPPWPVVPVGLFKTTVNIFIFHKCTTFHPALNYGMVGALPLILFVSSR